MNIFLSLVLLSVAALPATAAANVFSVFEGVKIKNGLRAEANFYYSNNWAKLREAALEKGFIDSYKIVFSDKPKNTGFDIGLLTRFKDRAQFEKAEENFRGLIADRGKVRLLNEKKPGDFRERAFVTEGHLPDSFFSTLPGMYSETRIKIENEGWELIGDFRIPFSFSGVPVVVLLNKANGNREVYKGLAEKLADNDIASLRIDLRAHGESINKGKFGPPFDEKMRSMLIGSDRDVAAITKWLEGRKEIDSGRIGIVGASYTGEQMMPAVGSGKFAKSYVGLSPGSFSVESAKRIDESGASWFFVKSVDEIALMKGVFEDIRKHSKTARILEVSGKAHASEIIDDHPDVEDIITLWFKENL